MLWVYYKRSYLDRHIISGSNGCALLQNHINALGVKMKLQHNDQKQLNYALLSIWLVALCPGLNAVDSEGWLFILITISPFTALF